ncbi:hypothetical protein A7U60_g517 [Sanghuangporus baumii]|uniref:Uncharacterized protein n=1 Tax=Sanghuangporus baumii TaxID=108892 RepID=A0A9Q5I5D5_SANBA|nr:hypothetical protein A7U60_g517 [Sanghuangporus baumii]
MVDIYGVEEYRLRSEAHGGLVDQVTIFFADNPHIEAAIGIWIVRVFWKFSIFTKEDVGTPKEDDNDNASYIPSSDYKLMKAANDSSNEEISEDSNSGPSSPDELDIIDKPEDPSQDELEEMKRQIKNADNEDTLYYELGTERREAGLKRLIEVIRNLNGCKEFEGMSFYEVSGPSASCVLSDKSDCCVPIDCPQSKRGQES